ncbi:hypothetical protein [Vibrio cholerae]|uniref:hypothetical protein n=1 Tax=Vibrio cholerae TaxID=666 RepID=UPI0015CF53BA|nr:hypothetical protein [Vibrio cholerae]
MKKEIKDNKSSSSFGATEIIALSSLTVAICSFLFTVFLFYDAHTKTKLSLFPNVNTSFFFKTSEKNIKWIIANSGLGPAKISWFSVKSGEEQLTGWMDLATRLGLGAGDNYSFTNVYPGEFLPEGHSGTLFEINGSEKYADIFKNAQSIEIQVCYCSIFNECYLSTSTHSVSVKSECDEKQMPNWGPI